jgi:hypothetical protein
MGRRSREKRERRQARQAAALPAGPTPRAVPSWLPRAAGAVWFGCCALFVGYGVWIAAVEPAILRLAWERADGTVADFRPLADARDPRGYPVVGYEVDGRAYTVAGRKPVPLEYTLLFRDRVAVYYPPGRPGAGRVCDWQLDRRWEGLLLVGLGLSLGTGGWAWYRRRIGAFVVAAGLTVGLIVAGGWATPRW